MWLGGSVQTCWVRPFLNQTREGGVVCYLYIQPTFRSAALSLGIMGENLGVLHLAGKPFLIAKTRMRDLKTASRGAGPQESSPS